MALFDGRNEELLRQLEEQKARLQEKFLDTLVDHWLSRGPEFVEKTFGESIDKHKLRDRYNARVRKLHAEICGYDDYEYDNDLHIDWDALAKHNKQTRYYFDPSQEYSDAMGKKSLKSGKPEADMAKVQKDVALTSSEIREETAQYAMARRTELSKSFSEYMEQNLVGQARAVKALVKAYQKFLLGFNIPGRPIKNLLFAGPTGQGKTRAVEVACEALFGNKAAMVKINCGEFQHSHEIAKLIGSPPGYLGHRETPALLTQEAINSHQTPPNNLTFVLFDEIEKANESLWELLLGILDKATVRLGNNSETNMENCVIVMTSNLGAKEMDKILAGKSIGFQKPDTGTAVAAANTAIKGNFTPEFMNRVDEVVVFDTLTSNNLRRIFDLHLDKIQDMIAFSKTCPSFRVVVSEKAAEYIIKEGTHPVYGARELNRAIDRLVVQPITDMLLEEKIKTGQKITIDLKDGKLIYS